MLRENMNDDVVLICLYLHYKDRDKKITKQQNPDKKFR